MKQQHVYVVVVMDPLDEAQFSQLVEDLRALACAHRNGCGRQHPASVSGDSHLIHKDELSDCPPREQGREQ